MAKNPEKLDRRVAESRRSKFVQYLAQLGGMAVSGYSAYKYGMDPGLEFWGGQVSGVGMTILGTRLGLDRGAAIRRNREADLGIRMGVTGAERQLARRVGGSRAPGIIGPFGVNGAAAMTGIIEEIRNLDPDASILYPPPGISIPFLVGAGVLASSITKEAGMTYDTPPALHRLTHL